MSVFTLRVARNAGFDTALQMGIACRMELSHRYIPTRATWPAELALMAAIGAFFALAGLFDSSTAPFPLRLIYWEAIMLTSGVVIILTEMLWHRYGPARLQNG